jgi:Ca2+-binding EF-hand superfamily protein
MRKTWIGLAALALLASGCASGGGGRGGPPPGFDDEAEGPPRPRVQLFISPSGQPFRAPGDAPYPSAAWFAQADADHDGRLTRAEFRADAEAWFKVLDANGDGQISMPEVTRWEEELVPEILRGGGGGGGAGMRRQALSRNQLDSRRDGAAAYSLINEPHPIRGADADFSMSVSAREWTAAADRRFAILDADGNGAILATELKLTPAQVMRANGPQQSRQEPPRRRAPMRRAP